jgi:hypothetical protein
MDKYIAVNTAQMICLRPTPHGPAAHLYMVYPGDPAYICKVCSYDFDDHMKNPIPGITGPKEDYSFRAKIEQGGI